ncbi:phosphatase [Sulfurimonas sp. MAG313]|nr:phosphatase [Sulfurimonas sp. MAG313]MDF1880672.1 phosphatase [Sulfurimonas sp. MAG313]
MIAIDLGSNSLRFVQRECKTKKFINEYEKIVKTAELLHSDNIISKGAIQRILEGFKEAKLLMNFDNESCVAVTTEALRRADNSQEVIEEIYQETGVRFKVIGASKEAELTLTAVDKRLESLGFKGSFILIDIGGGSTEIIFKKGNLSESKSFPVGIVTMASKYPSKEEVRQHLEEELSQIKAYAKEYYEREGKPDFFVATAGTPTTISAFLQGMNYNNYDASRINGSTLNYFDCEMALDRLLDFSFDERASYVGVGREELIISGVMIYAGFFRVLDFEDSVIIDDGLREGLAILACEERLNLF